MSRCLAAFTMAILSLAASTVAAQADDAGELEEPIRLGFDSHFSVGGPFGAAGVSARYIPVVSDDGPWRGSLMLEAGVGVPPNGIWTAGALIHFGWTRWGTAQTPSAEKPESNKEVEPGPTVTAVGDTARKVLAPRAVSYSFIGFGLGVNATDRECASFDVLSDADCARDTLRGNLQLTYLHQAPSGWRLGGYLGMSGLLHSVAASNFEYGGGFHLSGSDESEEEEEEDALRAYQDGFGLFPFFGATLGYGF